MKRYFTSKRYKRVNKSRSQKHFRNQTKRKRKIYRDKTSEKKLPKTKNQKRPRTIQAPKNFSLINNTTEIINYFDLGYENLKKGKPIHLDISKIEKLTPDAIAIQTAKISDQRYHCNTVISGNAPDNEDLKTMFFQSGFYEYVQSKGEKPTNKHKLIHKITNNRVEPEVAKEVSRKGIQYTFKQEKIFEPLYNIFIEVMQNTNNHAGESRGEYDWWIHVYNEPQTNKTIFTFLDLGAGIFDSLPVQNYWWKFQKSLNLTSNIDLVDKLFNGEIKSRTGRKDRGKGLPQIFDSSKNKEFNKFVLISNDVYADLKAEKWHSLDKNFNGTIFYFELGNPEV